MSSRFGSCSSVDDLDAVERDARLPVDQRAAHDALDRAMGRRRVGLEQEIAQAAAELGQHRPLAALGQQNDLDRLLDVVLVGGVAQATADRLHREGPADAEESFGRGRHGW